ncbi:MAG TPA: hypothetical protein VH595_20360 [Verrucomicrobiae bacterium]|nr:hypothetical protein [Verrucomicrobiae bacterium]
MLSCSTNIPGATTNLLQLTNTQSTKLGTYSVIVSNAYTNITSSNVLILPSQVVVWGGENNESNLPRTLTNLPRFPSAVWADARPWPEITK